MNSLPKLICVAGFGDDATMFTPLLNTSLSKTHEIIPFNLPGFGAPPLSTKSTLENLSKALASFAKQIDARIILAHSVASIIAALAARRKNSTIEIILSLEGNLTSDDAYFSGTAASFQSAAAFRTAFLSRLATMELTQPIITRYKAVVSTANPMALWELGTDAYHYSQCHIPGNELRKSARAAYLYNPDNIPKSSLDWLEENNIPKVILGGATHWKSVDQPDLLAGKIQKTLDKM